ncbi:MAG: hypothetical protein AUG51_07345 [Acidobacteria bacterium 13_1_20CM_3_53_8]|nr:MAG: hypothetical protein AUG51_07345 [Acidobacteria bacterium 13_1_20CM_3_53_8]
MSEPTHTIELIEGYKDDKGTEHKRVTFGHRIMVREIITLDTDPQGNDPTQYQDLLHRASIIEFGALSMPVPLSVLLSLFDIDREDIASGYKKFQELSSAGHTSEFLSDNKVKLGWGFERNGLTYPVVKFGNRLTGMDEVAANGAKLKGIARSCFLLGRQISAIMTGDSNAKLDGPLELEWFDNLLDAADILTLLAASELWRQSFRRKRTGILAKQSGT